MYNCTSAIMKEVSFLRQSEGVRVLDVSNSVFRGPNCLIFHELSDKYRKET